MSTCKARTLRQKSQLCPLCPTAQLIWQTFSTEAYLWTMCPARRIPSPQMRLAGGQVLNDLKPKCASHQNLASAAFCVESFTSYIFQQNAIVIFFFQVRLTEVCSIVLLLK